MGLLLLTQALGQPGHLVVGRGAEPVHFLPFGRQQAPQHTLAQAPACAAGHRGQHVQVVHHEPALVLWDRAEGLAGFQQEQGRGEHALADRG